jgi:pyruvate dehydrogenase E2 component (dihydrolipoamide acetyltransferase)
MPHFRLPDLGEGVTEGEIERWLVHEGQVVKEDDPLVEVITDKATAEIPSPFEGVVTKIHVDEGAVVPVGTVLVSIGEEEAAPQPLATPRPAAALARPQTTAGRVKAMPPVRKLARQLRVDIARLTGSGPNGRILREDVLAAADGHGVAAEAPPRPPREAIPRGGRRKPLRGVRRTIAERMAEAHRVVPPVTHVEECDVTELDATRRMVAERTGQKVTFLPFIVKAVVECLKDYPALNASLDEEESEIVFHDRYDMGVAVDTPQGLMVPVVKDADKKSLRAIAGDIERLARRAREGRLKPDDLRGSTFTITSPGPFGGLMATPIVFHPQSAILGVHRAGERPAVREGQIVIRKMMNLSVTFDHRVLDGMTAARFMLDLVKLLEHPAVLAFSD